MAAVHGTGGKVAAYRGGKMGSLHRQQSFRETAGFSVRDRTWPSRENGRGTYEAFLNVERSNVEPAIKRAIARRKQDYLAPEETAEYEPGFDADAEMYYVQRVQQN